MCTKLTRKPTWVTHVTYIDNDQQLHPLTVEWNLSRTYLFSFFCLDQTRLYRTEAMASHMQWIVHLVSETCAMQSVEDESCTCAGQALWSRHTQ